MSSYGRPAKRQRTSGPVRKRSFMRIPRRVSLDKPSSSVIIPIVTSYDAPLTADPSFAFQFAPQHLIVNGTAITITGAGDLNSTFELIRVHKVEVTVLPAATGLDYSAQTLSSGTTNIPYVYHAVDYVDPEGGRDLNQIRQNPTCRMDLLNRPIRRTLYPKIAPQGILYDMGTNQKNLFMRSNATTSLQENAFANGYVFLGDMKDQAWTYGQLRFNFKIFYECKMSK